MKIVYSDKHAKHDPQTFLVRGVIQKSAEQPERATRLLAAAKDAGHEIAAPGSFGLAPVQAIHTPEYIDFLQIAAREWAKLPGAGPEVVPNVHPARYPATYPKSLFRYVVGVLRWQIRLDERFKLLIAKPNSKLDPEVLVALRIGAFQLQFLDRVPEPEISTELDYLQMLTGEIAPPRQ